jgi:hypothetical protein
MEGLCIRKRCDLPVGSAHAMSVRRLALTNIVLPLGQYWSELTGYAVYLRGAEGGAISDQLRLPIGELLWMSAEPMKSACPTVVEVGF